MKKCNTCGFVNGMEKSNAMVQDLVKQLCYFWDENPTQRKTVDTGFKDPTLEEVYKILREREDRFGSAVPDLQL